MEPFTDNQKAILSTMIQEAVKASFNIDLRDFLKSTLDESQHHRQPNRQPPSTLHQCPQNNYNKNNDNNTRDNPNDQQ
jgi:hypothetical protein